MKPSFVIHKWLLPAGCLYGAVTAARNLLYNMGVFKQTKFRLPVICVGNITVGGTGKTPHTEYLIRLLQADRKVAVLSRGYGRKTKGWALADGSSSASQIGDEPYQIHTKFPLVTVAVQERRVDGVRNLMEKVNPSVILLDDAFQHRAIKPSLNILIVNCRRPITRDRMLPAGLLREPACGRGRADLIIVSKCPLSMTCPEMEVLAGELRARHDQPVFFTGTAYGEPEPLNPGQRRMTLSHHTAVLLVTGIADPAELIQHIQSFTRNLKTLTYPDHHQFGAGDLEEIQREFQELESASGEKTIITTEKDAARLKGMQLEEELAAHIHTVPVRVRFLKDEEKFNDTIIKHIENYGQ